MCFEEMTVDSRLFKHIIGKAGANVNKLKDEFNVVINIDESGLIRIEGSKDDVAKTKEDLEQRIFKLENEKERDVIIDHRHYRNIIGKQTISIYLLVYYILLGNLQVLKGRPSRRSETSSTKYRSCSPVKAKETT